jgi:hypothetical protein
VRVEVLDNEPSAGMLAKQAGTATPNGVAAKMNRRRLRTSC